ncbi:hypothetical protein BpHYR1_032241, partial [Brachionus plicatilis]
SEIEIERDKRGLLVVRLLFERTGQSGINSANDVRLELESLRTLSELSGFSTCFIDLGLLIKPESGNKKRSKRTINACNKRLRPKENRPCLRSTLSPDSPSTLFLTCSLCLSKFLKSIPSSLPAMENVARSSPLGLLIFKVYFDSSSDLAFLIVRPTTPVTCGNGLPSTTASMKSLEPSIMSLFSGFSKKTGAIASA